MSDEQIWVIQTEDLQVGTVLCFDLTDASGVVLHKSGMPISDRLKARLQKNGIHSVTIRGAAYFGADDAKSLLIGSYKSGSIEAMQELIAFSKLSLRKLAARIEKNQELELSELKGNVSDFVNQVSLDVAATLATIVLQSKESEAVAEMIMERSIKLSVLSVVTSVVRGDTKEQSFKIGLAGLLHDCSLMTEKGISPDGYLRHPVSSAELVKGAFGISNDVLTMISQVHEQTDGSGYPNQLTAKDSIDGASILNLVDAYLTLVEPMDGIGYVPSDAIAYLCYQAAQGRFSSKDMRAMLSCMSIYPVGSPVVLDDKAKAIVIEGNPGNPLEPTVRLFEPGNLSIELSNSNRNIAAPVYDRAQNRFPKSKLHEILWRTDR